MSYYDGPSWQGPVRQSSWDQPPPPSRGNSSTTSRDEVAAFGPQFEEVERAIDNLMKSGKLFGPRRDMGVGRQYSDFDPRMGGGSRHPSMDFDPMRSHSGSNLQNYYASARYQPRSSDADQMQQAKRRMAAQRERELRNYHQEQQYSRNVFSQGGKSDRSNSPSAMNDDERRELIARQHRALYAGSGADAGSPPAAGSPYFDGPHDGHTPRPGPAPPGAGNPSGPRGPSPLAYNSFGVPEPAAPAAGGSDDPTAPHNPKGPSPNASGRHSRADSTSSPASNAQSYSLFDAGAGGNPSAAAANPQAQAAQQQSSRTSASSPGGSPPRGGSGPAGKPGAPAPIGTRPVNPALSKRATPPASSPLSYGFAPGDGPDSGRAAGTPGSATPAGGPKEGVSWGSGSGVWGKSNLGNVQASVWG